jgi:hypothetical protein
MIHACVIEPLLDEAFSSADINRRLGAVGY